MSRSRTHSWHALLAAGALLAPLVACGGSEGAGGSDPAAAAAPAVSGVVSSADDPINKVVAISVDGLRPDAIARLGERVPHLQRLLREGARTTNARTAYESTRTLPNHTSMLTGRVVHRWRGGHGITVNSDDGGTVHDHAGEYVASVFDVVHDRGGRTALFASKPKFRLFNRSWGPRHGAPDLVGADNGNDKIDRFVVRESVRSLTDAVVADLRNGPRRFTFVHYGAPDRFGHRYGWMSRRYLNAVVRTDAQIGRVLATVGRSRYMRRHLAIVLTADHGGNGSGHGEADDLLSYRVPFLVWGPGTARGANLYRLNPDYAAPGTRRPGYRGAQPVRNGMLANLALDLLDLPSVPASVLDARQDLDVSR